MKTRKSVMTHQFSRVPKAEIQRSTFDRSHGVKTTFDGGYLVPILVDEALPGDTFNVNMTAFARMATPIFPLMDNLRMSTFFFAVPIRLLWENWQRFNGEQDNPGDSTDYVCPSFTQPGGYDVGSLSDYFGIPTGVTVTHNIFWHRAYNLIWNEWFRDQNLQDSLPFFTTDELDFSEPFELQRRGKRHDYFTSCLPFPQKGDPVSIPIAGQAPLTGDGDVFTTEVAGNVALRIGGAPADINDSYSMTGNSPTVFKNTTDGQDIPATLKADFSTGFADLSQASSFTINQLREAFQIQRLLERDARGGTRYIEIIKSHFGVTSPDARLQRPEYLGGGSSPVNISPIASTVPTTVTQETPQGTLAAVGTASLNNHGFTKGFTEHCVIIGLVSVQADLTYQQGLNRMFSRQTRYDYYWPALSHLGEQAVLSKEIYVDGTADDEEVFGYQERYAEYRYKPSMITGLFRSAAAESLDAWHLSQDFSERPLLNAAFIEDNPPIDRVIAVPSEPHFIFDAHFSMKCARPMPLYGVPGLIDHF